MKNSPFSRLPSLPPMISLPAILLAACLTGCEHTAPPIASADAGPNPDGANPNPNHTPVLLPSKDTIAMSMTAAATPVSAPYAATPWGKTHAAQSLDTATFGAGCFWGVESVFRKLDGVAGTAVGFSGGTVNEPTYKLVCQHRTGHAEVVQVIFDPTVVSYDKLLNVFWEKHDPTQVNRQGPDRGDQYRTVIFTHSAAQAATAEASKSALDKSGKLSDPIATQIVPFNKFWPAEDYHQQYLEKQGIDSCGTGH